MIRTLFSSRSRKVYDFHGGIHPPERKALSNGTAIVPGPMPAQLILPLNMHIGAPAKPLVEPGERVLKGQMIAEPSGAVSAAIHAPTSGTVNAIGPRAIQHPSGMDAICIVIDTDGKDEWIEHTGVLDPFILAVGVDDDTDGIHPGRVLNSARADGVDGAGGGGMNGRAHRAAGLGNHLAFQDSLTGFHQRFGRGADVHVQWQYQLRRHRAGDNGGAVGKRFPFRRVNTAVEVVDLAAARTEQGTNHRFTTSIRLSGRSPIPAGRFQPQVCRVGCTSTMSMQSTGQGSTHRSQPVHSSTITVCISLAAPTMASTGQAWMHLVQPMHSSSRI